MDRASSVDDIVSTFWDEASIGMNRSPSEFAFQDFLLKEARPKSRLGINNLEPTFTTPVTPMFQDEVAAFAPSLFPVEDGAKSFPGGLAAPAYKDVYLSRVRGLALTSVFQVVLGGNHYKCLGILEVIRDVWVICIY